MGNLAMFAGAVMGSALDPFIFVPGIGIGICLARGLTVSALWFGVLAVAVICGSGLLQRDGVGWELLPHRISAVAILALLAFGVSRAVLSARAR